MSWRHIALKTIQYTCITDGLKNFFTGYLQHRYEVQNTTMGYKVDKFHESEGKVYRKHRKVKTNYIALMVKVPVEGKT